MNPSITYLKALGILLVVLGHCGCSIPQVVPFLYMFHMPLFFFASGYCFKRIYLDAPKSYLWKKIKGIYWPYVKWNLIFLVFYNVFITLHIYGSDKPWYSLTDFFKHAYYIVYHMLDMQSLLGGYWFLAAIFSGSIVFWILLRVFKRIEIGGGISLIISILLNLYPGIESIDSVMLKAIPFSMIMLSSRTFEVATFIIVGYWFAHRRVKSFNGWLIICSLILTFVGTFYWRINSGLMFFDNKLYIPYVLTGILANWSFYSLFVKWKETDSRVSRIMTFIGKNTLTILTWHFLVFKLVSLIISQIYGLPVIRLAESPVIQEYASQGWWIAYFLVAVATCCGIAYCNKWIKSSWLKL